ncbi:SulP family inorganic anion transporter [uncultured Paludibaculum sp.]|uniref:SulP family inorganic anion transporter n=1 Tax=uncultured Paludibaculum sp. TaxID=1765020 RepID=UPI002AAB3BD3|nr:SulP family inorganic anion transporter [uncultured Paludibaculum sp.]
MQQWFPRSFQCLKNYNAKTFTSDLIAGVTVGLVALPLAMAFSIASGLSPQAGIYCAVVTGFLISLLGGSNTQIGGPTGAFVVVVAGIVGKYGVDGLFTCTMMAGVLLVIMAVTGMGSAVKFIPRPIVVGFTNGIALLIASTQIKDFFGLKIDKVPGEFIEKVETLAVNFHTLSLQETAIGVVALVVILFFVRFVPKVPGTIVALFGATAAVTLLNLNVETIGTRFGGIPSGLPTFEIPEFHWKYVRQLLSPAITVAMLGSIESLLSAVVADRMTKDKHNPNTELFGQGIANIVSPLFGGLPATGAIARTATSIRSGAKTPVAGMIHALTLLLVLLVAAPLAKNIPLAALAAILFIVSYNMGEWGEIPEILKLGKRDVSVWALTFLLTVFADLTVAVEFGMILAALVFISRVALTTTVSQVTDDYLRQGWQHILQDKQIPPYATIFRIHGPFLFGSTDKLDEVTSPIENLPPVVILRLRNMTAIDATGLQALELLADKLHDSGRVLILCGAPWQPMLMIKRAEFERHIGLENICVNVEAALSRAEAVYRTLPEAVRRSMA